MMHDDWEPATNKRISELETKVKFMSKQIDTLYDMVNVVNKRLDLLCDMIKEAHDLLGDE